MPPTPNAPVFASADGERSATWLELFFDLVFVVTVAALSYRFEHHFDVAGAGLMLLYFLPIWWLWMEFSYYGDLFDDNSVAYQTLMIVAMGGVVHLAVGLRDETTIGTLMYPLTYLFLAGVSLLMYARAYRQFADLRWFTRRFMGCIALSMGCWAASLLVEAPLRYYLWLTGVLIQALAAPSIYLLRNDYPVQLSHMPERFGLFSIIVLGEGIVALTAASESGGFRWPVALWVLGGFFLTACFWKLYFYEASKTTITEQLKDSSRYTMLKSFLYGYGHYFLYVSIICVSVALSMLIESAVVGHHTLHFAVSLLHTGAIGFLASITLIHWAAPESLFSSVLLARVVCMVLSILLLTITLPPLFEIYAQVVILAGLIFTEYRIYCGRGVVPGSADQQMDTG